MNIKVDLDLNIVIIICLLTSIIILAKLIFTKKQQVESFTDTDFDKLGDVINQRAERKQEELILDTVDKSLEKSKQKQGILRFEKASMNDELMNEYLNQLINADYNNPNKVLVSNDQFELPTVIEDNLNQYNHDMRKLNNSKSVKQDYTIKVLKYKIRNLLTSMKSVKEFQEELESGDYQHLDVTKQV